jgi:hypothetical protein
MVRTTIVLPDEDFRELKALAAAQAFLVRDPIVAFLAIKHHRQLSFDLHGFWP